MLKKLSDILNYYDSEIVELLLGAIWLVFFPIIWTGQYGVNVTLLIISILLGSSLIKGTCARCLKTKKTLAYGSFLFSISFTLLILHFFAPNLPIEKFLIVATSISLASQLGDLFFSLLKRKSGFKDTGKILPGHGGILDRIDGILFGLPFGMLVLIILFK